MTEFLIVNCPLEFNGVIGRSFLKALKIVISIYHLTIKFPTAKGTGHVKRTQYDLRECYTKSIKLTEKVKRLPQIMEIRVPSVGLIETNIDPFLQEDEPVARLVEELIEVLVDPNEMSRVVKIGKNWKAS